MHTWESRIIERDIHGRLRVACPPEHLPAPGRYLLGWRPGAAEAPVGVALFPAELPAPEEGAAWFVPAASCTGNPGDRLRLRGPLGKGFRLSAAVRRLAAFTPRRAPWRLLPAIQNVLRRGGEAVLFSGGAWTGLPLPSALEILPPAALPETLRSWADYWIADLPLESLPGLPAALGSRAPAPPGAVLVDTPMPCGGLADCGVCALRLGSKTLLACRDGPVFEGAALLSGLAPGAA